MIIASEDCEMGHVEERLGQGGMTLTPIMILRADSHAQWSFALPAGDSTAKGSGI